MAIARKQFFWAATLLPLCLALSGPGSAETGHAKTDTLKADQTALKEIRDASSRLRRAALDLIDEVEQRDMVVTGEPFLIQPVVEKKDPKPGTMEEMIVLGNALPPRKKWVELTMSELEKLTAILDQERSSIAAGLPALSGSLDELGKVIDDINRHCDNLKRLTGQAKLQNLPIGREALAIYQDTAKLEKPWKELLEMIKND